jgi:hypothetical protein
MMADAYVKFEFPEGDVRPMREEIAARLEKKGRGKILATIPAPAPKADGPRAARGRRRAAEAEE